MHHQNVDLEIQQNNLLLVGSKKGVEICHNPLGLQKKYKRGTSTHIQFIKFEILFAKSYTALKCAQ